MAVQKKVRFNIVDFLLIVLVILSVVALFLRPTVLKKVEQLTATDTAVVSFYADGLTEEECNILAAGDVLSAGNGADGELLSFSVQPYQTLHLIESDVQSESSFFKEVTEPGLYTVKGQARLTGARKDDGFYVDGNLQIGVGSILQVQSDSYILTLEITGIS
ncbi:MAG: DUF4330 family protein [Clostridia bacterium]|nr:DUF4330 family protein [Clostridia bacterium]